MTQSASVHRKNQGKHFTVVDQTSYVFHWHRPGEHLPKLLQHPSGVRFLLTQEKVDEALKYQRSTGLKIDVDAQVIVPPLSYVNGKGIEVCFLPNQKQKNWETIKALAAYAAVCGAPIWAGLELTKVL